VAPTSPIAAFNRTLLWRDSARYPNLPCIGLSPANRPLRSVSTASRTVVKTGSGNDA